MKVFTITKSNVLERYESYNTFKMECYQSGVIIYSKQDQVVKTSAGTKRHSDSVVTGLKHDEAIRMRDYLIANYPIGE